MATGSAAMPGPELTADTASGFEHLACVYGSDQEFLEMAVPFLEKSRAAGAGRHHGCHPRADRCRPRARGGNVDYAESAFFGRRPPQRIAAFHRY
jgi:hypothetical protein